MAYLAVAFGGALGAMSRYWVYNALLDTAEDGFPYGTLLVNILGSLLIGVLFVLVVERQGLDTSWQNILGVGFLGAFTTFSTFSLEAVGLLEKGQYGTAMFYILGSLLLCLLAAWLGLVITRQI